MRVSSAKFTVVWTSAVWRTLRRRHRGNFQRIARLSGASYIDFDSIQIQSTQTTLNELTRRISVGEAVTYQRFGDGDVGILLGQDDSYQKWSPSLGYEMAEAFGLDGDRFMKCLPIHSEKFGREEDMVPGFHLTSDVQAQRVLTASYAYMQSKDIWSPYALVYAAVYQQEEAAAFLRAIRERRPTLICNDTVAETMSRLLDASVVIVGPSKNAYGEIDRIEQEVFDSGPGSIFCTALGMAGRVLGKRLALRLPDASIIDLGSAVDALAGDFSTRASSRLEDADRWKGLATWVARGADRH